MIASKLLAKVAVLAFAILAMGATSSAAPFQIPEAPRIIFVGNSLTYGRIHAEWPGGWGMAASQPDKDYVHRVQLMAAALTGQIPEIRVASLDLIYPQHFPAAQELGRTWPADILVIELGDAAQQMTRTEYKAALKGVIGWYQFDKLIITGVWYVPRLEAWNREVAEELGAAFVPLNDLNVPSNWQQPDCAVRGSVCDHPGDRGMEMIAERVLAAILQERTTLYLPWLVGE